MEISAKQIERFWAHVDQSDPEGCWPWTSTVMWGYGYFHLGPKRLRAHRVALELATGEAPGDRFVLHRCDNPRCVNPAHLYFGTPADNMRDKVRHRRQTRGEDVNTAKLTEDKVREMRELREDGFTLKELAARYGVRHNMVLRIVKRRAWKHVT